MSAVGAAALTRPRVSGTRQLSVFPLMLSGLIPLPPFCFLLDWRLTLDLSATFNQPTGVDQEHSSQSLALRHAINSLTCLGPWLLFVHVSPQSVHEVVLSFIAVFTVLLDAFLAESPLLVPTFLHPVLPPSALPFSHLASYIPSYFPLLTNVLCLAAGSAFAWH